MPARRRRRSATIRTAPPHSDAAHRIILAELVRLTLPHHGERPELEVA